jgi:transcriptional regulator with XRE-family HTH domain
MSETREMEPVYAKLGRWVRRVRKSNALTQAQLAELMGLDRSSVASIETGRQRVLLHSLVEFAELMGYRLTLTKIR